jgi:hypothetical protein
MAPSLRSPFSPANPARAGTRAVPKAMASTVRRSVRMMSSTEQVAEPSCDGAMRFLPSLKQGLPVHRSPPPRFDTHFPPVLPVKTCAGVPGMSENDALYCIRHADGSVSLYIDEEYAAERGVDPATLTRVEIPRELFSTGTIQQIREYVAVYLEGQQTGTA